MTPPQLRKVSANPGRHTRKPPPRPPALGRTLRRCLAMVVAVIDHQPNAQRQLPNALLGTGQEPPGDIGRIGTRFEPDPRLDANEPYRKEPDRDAAIETKGLDMHVTGRADRPAAPAVGEQRPAPLAVDEFRIGLDPDQPAPERRVHRRNQQSMIPPRQAEGDRAGGIAAAPVGEPPFAALGLMEVAADRPAEADHVRHRDPSLLAAGRVVADHPGEDRNGEHATDDRNQGQAQADELGGHSDQRWASEQSEIAGSSNRGYADTRRCIPGLAHGAKQDRDHVGEPKAKKSEAEQRGDQPRHNQRRRHADSGREPSDAQHDRGAPTPSHPVAGEPAGRHRQRKAGKTGCGAIHAGAPVFAQKDCGPVAHRTLSHERQERQSPQAEQRARGPRQHGAPICIAGLAMQQISRYGEQQWHQNNR